MMPRTLWVREPVRHWDEFVAMLGERVYRCLFKENAH